MAVTGVPDGSWTVRVVGEPVAPGVIVGGVNTATAPIGKPVADIVTTLLKAPPRGGTVSGMLTSAPCGAVIGAVGPTTANPGVTVTIVAVEVEVAEVALPE